MDLQPNAQDNTRRDVRAASAQMIADIDAGFKKLANIFWQNPYGLAPQAAFDTLGTDGPITPASIFESAGDVQKLLARYGHEISSPVPDGAEVKFDEKGGVVITLPPPPPPANDDAAQPE